VVVSVPAIRDADLPTVVVVICVVLAVRGALAFPALRREKAGAA
jgi:hypothetical protein